jgi:hypothetical protein
LEKNARDLLVVSRWSIGDRVVKYLLRIFGFRASHGFEEKVLKFFGLLFCVDGIHKGQGPVGEFLVPKNEYYINPFRQFHFIYCDEVIDRARG